MPSPSIAATTTSRKNHFIMSDDHENGERLAAIAELVAKYKMALNNKKRRTLLGMNEKAFHAYELGLIVSRCCRDLDLDGAFQAYLKAKDFGAVPSAETFHNLLSLTAGLGEQGSGQTLVRDKEPPHDLEAALVVYDGMIEHNVNVAESSYTAMIRCCCVNGQPFRGLQFYKDMQKQEIAPKLRTLTSLLDALSIHDTSAQEASTGTGGNHTKEEALGAGFALYDELLHRYALEPTEKEYLYMLRLCLANKDARFYDILKALGESGIVPVSAELRTVLTQWFTTVETGYTVTHSLVQKDGTVAVNGERLKSLDVDEQFREEFVKQLEGFAVSFDEAKGYKPNNKVREQQQILAMKALLQKQDHGQSTEDREAAVSADGVSQSSTTGDAGHSAGTNSDKPVSVAGGGGRGASSRQDLWNDFAKFLRYHRENPTQAATPKRTTRSRSVSHVEDGGEGAVVTKKARYESNDSGAGDKSSATTEVALADSGTANSTSISNNGHSHGRVFNGKLGFNIIVDGANVGYFKQNYSGAPSHVNYQQIDQLLQHLRSLGHTPLLILHSRHLGRHMVPDAEAEQIIQRWRSDGCLYATPKGFNDDWFWLYAAVSQRCRVVTNDEMRDHHFQLLSPKWFNRWRERNRVQFTFGVWQDQQLRQQQKSVVSGSSNSACNSATLRALRYMPVTLTSDVAPSGTASTAASATSAGAGSGGVGAPNAESGDGHESGAGISPGDSNEGGGSSDDDSSSDEDTATHTEADVDAWAQRRAERQTAKELRKAQMKRVSLRWPSPYSYCLQHVTSARCDGYYCPPMPPAEEGQTATAAVAAARTGDRSQDKDTAGVSALDKGVFGMTAENAHNEWLCIFKAV